VVRSSSTMLSSRRPNAAPCFAASQAKAAADPDRRVHHGVDAGERRGQTRQVGEVAVAHVAVGVGKASRRVRGAREADDLCSRWHRSRGSAPVRRTAGGVVAPGASRSPIRQPLLEPIPITPSIGPTCLCPERYVDRHRGALPPNQSGGHGCRCHEVYHLQHADVRNAPAPAPTIPPDEKGP
jgi:hypothetical protein